MPFFRIPLFISPTNELLYRYAIIEAEDATDAYDRAANFMAFVVGDPCEPEDNEMPEGVEDIVEIANPLSEPWPIFTIALQEREDAYKEERDNLLDAYEQQQGGRLPQPKWERMRAEFDAQVSSRWCYPEHRRAQN